MLKKKSFVLILLAALVVVSGMMVSSSFAESAYDQAQRASDDGWNAAHTSNPDDARHVSGHVFDTPSDSPQPVDLSNAGEHPTPRLLTNSDGSNPYTPSRYRSLRPSHVPPLPAQQ